MVRRGGQPTAAIAITCTSFSRAAWLHNDSSFMLGAQSQTFVVRSSSCASRSFFRLLALYCHAFEWQSRYKSGRICAQLPVPFSVPEFHLRRSIYSSLSTVFQCPRISLFFSSTRSSFTFLRVAVSYKLGRICAQLPLSVPQF